MVGPQNPLSQPQASNVERFCLKNVPARLAAVRRGRLDSPRSRSGGPTLPRISSTHDDTGVPPRRICPAPREWPQVRRDGGNMRVMWPQDAFANLNGASCQWFSACITAARVLETTEIVIDGRCLERSQTQTRFDNGERATIERLCLVVARDALVQRGQSTQGGRYLQVVRPERAVSERQGFAEQEFRFMISSLDSVKSSKAPDGLHLQASISPPPVSDAATIFERWHRSAAFNTTPTPRRYRRVCQRH